MDYEQKYREALSRAKQFSEKSYLEDSKGIVEYIFPELKESEDEKMRRWIINYLDNKALNSGIIQEKTNIKNAIAWLEKQSTPQVRTGLELVNTIDDACDKRYSEEYAHGEYCNEQSFKWGFQEGVDWLEKQGEQKPDDKVKPRYSIGDVLCDKSCTTLNKDAQPNFEILDIKDGAYICDNGSIPISQQDEYELVAKKIEQNPAWSEEDDIMKQNCHQMLALLRPNSSELIKDIIDNCHHWLKSLKDRVQPQNTWKPSEEQMKALSAINLTGGISYAGQGEELINLYNDLKRLLKI